MFTKIRSTIEGFKAGFRLFIHTIETNSARLEALADEQKMLREKFDVLVQHTSFLARAKKNEMDRAGHKVV